MLLCYLNPVALKDTRPRPQTSGIIQQIYRNFLGFKLFPFEQPKNFNMQQGHCILTYSVGQLMFKKSSEQITNTEVFIYSVNSYMKGHYEWDYTQNVDKGNHGDHQHQVSQIWSFDMNTECNPGAPNCKSY
jgi:hypothetical protein